MPEISVIIPTFNYAKYIEGAIDSVLSQTFREFEIIIIDDGSTDNTKRIIETNYKDAVRYFFQRNKGAPTARNFGLNKAKGRYVVFLDADDWLLPGAIEDRTRFLDTHPENGWVYGPTCYKNSADECIKNSLIIARLAQEHRRHGHILSYLLLGELIPICSVMVKTSLIREVGGFNTHLKYLQDYELWLRVAARSPVGFIKEPNVVVRVHEKSISRSTGDGFRTWLSILQEAERRYPDTVKKLGYSWRKRISHIMAERGRHMIKEGDHQQGLRLIRDAIAKDPLNLKHYAGYLKAAMASF